MTGEVDANRIPRLKRMNTQHGDATHAFYDLPGPRKASACRHLTVRAASLWELGVQVSNEGAEESQFLELARPHLHLTPKGLKLVYWRVLYCRGNRLRRARCEDKHHASHRTP